MNQGNIQWGSEEKLDWSDFKGAVPSDINNSAYTSYEVQVKCEVRSPMAINYEIECVFIPNKSWVSAAGRENNKLLEHEQVHFDIGECSARSMRKVLKNNKISVFEANDYLLQVNDSIIDVWERMQVEYDHETKHGTVFKAQHKWTSRIDSILLSLDAYSEVSFEVPTR